MVGGSTQIGEKGSSKEDESTVIQEQQWKKRPEWGKGLGEGLSGSFEKGKVDRRRSGELPEERSRKGV